jgi:hypothetical protein
MIRWRPGPDLATAEGVRVRATRAATTCVDIHGDLGCAVVNQRMQDRDCPPTKA